VSKYAGHTANLSNFRAASRTLRSSRDRESTNRRSRDFATKLRRSSGGSSERDHCTARGSTRSERRTDDPWRIRERRNAEPFSRIVRVKSPRVWDVICSTLVLYRGTTGLGRGVGVFKGDYTQRQGWLYWRTPPAVLTRRSFQCSQEHEISRLVDSSWRETRRLNRRTKLPWRMLRVYL